MDELIFQVTLTCITLSEVLDCPDADVKQTLIWLIERIITDVFTKSYHESIKRMESSVALIKDFVTVD